MPDYSTIPLLAVAGPCLGNRCKRSLAGAGFGQEAHQSQDVIETLGRDRPAHSERGPLCMSLHQSTCLAMPAPTRVSVISSGQGARSTGWSRGFSKPVHGYESLPFRPETSAPSYLSIGREILRDDRLERLGLDTKVTKRRPGTADHLVGPQQPDLIASERRMGEHLQQPAQQLSRPEPQGHQQRPGADGRADKLKQLFEGIDPGAAELVGLAAAGGVCQNGPTPATKSST